MQLERLFKRLKFEYLPDQLDTVCEQVIATAILDRLLHHATTVNIKGESMIDLPLFSRLRQSPALFI